MALSINELKSGLTILVDGQVFVVVSYQHVKPGKGAAFVRVRIKNIKNENVLERTYRTDDKIEEAFVDVKKLQYQYRAGDTYHFMCLDTYEEIAIDQKQLGNTINFLKDNLEISAAFYEGQLVNVTLPTSIVLKVTSTQTGIRGDTVKTGTKPATIETGFTVQVPLFINEGDLIKIDTRTGEYVERA
ncbi:MAG: elongation factor P [Candidatus Omnitrophota bacterium]